MQMEEVEQVDPVLTKEETLAAGVGTFLRVRINDEVTKET